MPRRRAGGFAPHASTALVAAVLLLAAGVGTYFTRDAVRGDASRLLKERTNEVAVVLNNSISSLAVDLRTLGQVARVTDGLPSAFTTTADAAKGAQRGLTYALLRAAASGYIVVLSDGPGLRSGEVVTGVRAGTFALAMHSSGPVATPVLGSGADRRFGIALGPPGAPPGMVVYRESALGPLGPPRQASTAPFHELQVVLYAVDRPVPAEALVSTAPTLPLRGAKQDQFLTLGHSRLLLTVAADAPLVGQLTANAPWVVGGSGLLLTALISFLVEQASRRRDQAMALYTAQRNVAETLQRSLLPDLVPLSGLDVASRYLPGAAEQQIGGDWFDCFALGPGPDGDSRVAVVIGDVMGHDMQAAAAMAQVRSAIRAYSCESDGPARVLQRLHHLVEVLDIAPLVSVFCGVLGPPSRHGVRVLRYANAGHPPPFLLTGDGAVRRLDQATSTIIGAPEAEPRSECTLEVAPGSALVLFTDGLVETPGGALSDSLDLLSTGLSDQRPDATAEEVCEWLASRVRGPLRDDVAILVLRVAAGAPPLLGSVLLECDQTAAGRARSWLAGQMAGWPDATVDSARLLVSELVTNAVLHARTAVTVVIERGQEEVRVAVADSSPSLPAIKHYAPTAETGRGFRLLTAMASDWGIQPTTDGKEIWFTLCRSDVTAPKTPPADLFASADLAEWPDLDAWPDTHQGGDGRAPGALRGPGEGGDTPVEICILRLPIRVYSAAAEHNDALLREMALIPASEVSRIVPPADLALAEALRRRFNPLTRSLRRQVEAAVAAGRPTLDLRVPVRPGDWRVLTDLADQLDAADRLCRAGEFLTLAPPAEVLLFRQWFAKQVADQMQGQPPTPWPYG